MKRTPLTRKTRLRRTKRMPAMSDKRRKLRLHTDPRRNAFVEETGCCMRCGRDYGGFDVHEIASGPHREKALNRPELWLCLCRWCHTPVQHLPHAEQFAIRARFEIERAVWSFNDLRDRPQTALTTEEVMRYLACAKQ